MTSAPPDPTPGPLELIRSLFLDTLREVSIPRTMQSRIHLGGSPHPETLHIAGLTYDLRRFHRIFIVAIGKASLSMCESLLPILEPALNSSRNLQGIAVAPVLPGHPDPRIRFLRGGHPLPDAYSFLAADAILNLLSPADSSTLVLFLISGGASAMVEKPLDLAFAAPPPSPEETALFHQGLVASGLPITQMNVLRKHLSAVKGGRLAVAAYPATQCTLLISDVPAGALDTIGSGPSLPDTSTVRQCRDIVAWNRLSLALPASVLDWLEDPRLPETPKPDHPAFDHASWLPLLSSDDLSLAASRLAERAGFTVHIDNTCDEWDPRRASRFLIDRLRSLGGEHQRICLLSVGELSVHLPPTHGTGGRNQQFVLECARILCDETGPSLPPLPFIVLSAGSDGIDGSSPAAGALCDSSTWHRAHVLGLDPGRHLARFDAFPFFEALGDTLHTGPTGNNLRDLRILLGVPANPAATPVA